MVTKGIIQTLDLLGNTCTVRMPLFETSGNDEITGTATISNTPGSYNGYRVGDVVWIAFEDGQMNTPVVIGKLYLGAEAERNDPRGVINVESSTVTKNAAVPADTKLTAQIDSNMPNTNLPYNSLYSVANELNSLKVSVAQNDRDYGNRFKQTSEVVTDATKKVSEIEQTATEISTRVEEVNTSLDGKITLANSRIDQNAGNIALVVEETIPNINDTLETHSAKIATNADNITAEVSARTEAVSGLSTELNSKITQNATDISAKVSKTQGDSSSAFGWNLTDNSWKIFNQDKDILIANEDGLEVKGKIEAEKGHIGNFTIGEEVKGHSGIYSDNYKDKNDKSIISFKNDNKDWEFNNDAEGIYIGTDGIRLGPNFAVDVSGNLIAKSMTVIPDQITAEIETKATTIAANYISANFTSNGTTYNGDTIHKIQVQNNKITSLMRVDGNGDILSVDPKAITELSPAAITNSNLVTTTTVVDSINTALTTDNNTISNITTISKGAVTTDTLKENNVEINIANVKGLLNSDPILSKKIIADDIYVNTANIYGSLSVGDLLNIVLPEGENEGSAQIAGFNVSANALYSNAFNTDDTLVILSTDGVVYNSDRALKENEINLSESSDYDKFFDALESKTFNFIKDETKTKHIGFTAQDIQTALENSGLTTTDFAGYKTWQYNKTTDDETEEKLTSYGLDYTEFIALNTNQIQKLKTRVQSLEDKIAELEELLKNK